MPGRALGYDAIPERRQHDRFGEALRGERAMPVYVSCVLSSWPGCVLKYSSRQFFVDFFSCKDNMTLICENI